MFLDSKTGLAVHPAYLQPTLIGWKPGPLPDAFTVMCFGPVGRGPIDMMGRTPMTHERRTLFRYDNETDESLQQRIDEAVMHFKRTYGWNQHVSVHYDYDLSAELGQLHQSWDDLINLQSRVHHLRNAGEMPHYVAEAMLVCLADEMRKRGVGCVPPGLH